MQPGAKACALVLLVAAVTAAAEEPPAPAVGGDATTSQAQVVASIAPASIDYEARDEFFASADGTRLHARVIRPAGLGWHEPTPVVLVVGPYRAIDDPFILAGETPDYRVRDLAVGLDGGYTIVDVSLRGYGKSAGCGDLYGPAEQADVVAAVEWSASQEWSTGKVAIFGLSYEGWSGIVGLAEEPRGLAAVVVSAPVVSAYRSMYLNGVPYWHTGRTLQPTVYAAQRALTGDPEDRLPSCYADTQRAVLAEDDHGYWDERDLVAAGSGSRIPVLWTHGFQDIRVKPDHFSVLYPTLRGPKQAWLGHFNHSAPREVDGQAFADAVFDFLDRHLRQTSPAAARHGASVRVQDDDGRWRNERSWPPHDAEPFAIPLTGGSYLDVPTRNSSTASAQDQAAGVWMFTQPLPYDLHIAGAPTLQLELDPERPTAYVLATIYDVDEDGVASLVTAGAFLVCDAGDQTVEFDLYAQDWTVEPGHRLGFLIAGGTDEGWIEPGGSGGRVHVAEGRIDIPFLRFERTEHVDGQPAQDPEFGFGATPIQLLETTIEHVVHVDLPPPMRSRA